MPPQPLQRHCSELVLHNGAEGQGALACKDDNKPPHEPAARMEARRAGSFLFSPPDRLRFSTRTHWLFFRPRATFASMSATPVIHIDELVIRYGDFTAVDHLNLQLHQGELFGLLGPNGAGKSSTLRVLIGQRRPSAGKVTIAGQDIVRDWAAIKPKFGYVPDRENNFEEFSGLRNLLIFAGLYGVSAKRAEECLDLVELTEAAHLPVAGYSLGMRRKLLLARALLHKPPILYLDEPTANLDIHSAALVRQTLRNLVEAGSTVLLTTHNMQEVEEICDRVAILNRGKLIALDTPLSMRLQHSRRVVDATLEDGSRLVFDLEHPAERQQLAERVTAGGVASLRTRDFNFHEAFLKLTGTEFT